MLKLCFRSRLPATSLHLPKMHKQVVTGGTPGRGPSVGCRWLRMWMKNFLNEFQYRLLGLCWDLWLKSQQTTDNVTCMPCHFHPCAAHSSTESVSIRNDKVFGYECIMQYHKSISNLKLSQICETASIPSIATNKDDDFCCFFQRLSTFQLKPWRQVASRLGRRKTSEHSTQVDHSQGPVFWGVRFC